MCLINVFCAKHRTPLSIHIYRVEEQRLYRWFLYGKVLNAKNSQHATFIHLLCFCLLWFTYIVCFTVVQKLVVVSYDRTKKIRNVEDIQFAICATMHGAHNSHTRGNEEH